MSTPPNVVGASGRKTLTLSRRSIGSRQRYESSEVCNGIHSAASTKMVMKVLRGVLGVVKEEVSFPSNVVDEVVHAVEKVVIKKIKCKVPVLLNLRVNRRDIGTSEGNVKLDDLLRVKSELHEVAVGDSMEKVICKQHVEIIDLSTLEKKYSVPKKLSRDEEISLVWFFIIVTYKNA